MAALAPAKRGWSSVREDDQLQEQQDQPQQADADDSPAVQLRVNDEPFTTTERVLNVFPASFLVNLLESRIEEDGDSPLIIVGQPGLTPAVFRVVLQFLSHWLMTGPLLDADIAEEVLEELTRDHGAADFLGLPAMKWFASAHKVTRLTLDTVDSTNRQQEDALRWMFAHERDSPILENLHLGLQDIHTAALAPTESAYPVVFDFMSPKNLNLTHINDRATVFEEFNEHYPGLLAALDTINAPPDSGWFVAGGSVLRCLLADPAAAQLYEFSDVDIFIWARGSDAEAKEKATELSR